MDEKLEMTGEVEETVQNEENTMNIDQEVEKKVVENNGEVHIKEESKSEEHLIEETKSEESEQAIQKKGWKGKGKIFLLGVATAILIAGGSAYAYTQTPEQRMIACVSLGNKYLNEVDYEQAVVEFNKALEIEPRNREALLGIMEASARLGDNESFQSAFGSFLNICCDEENISEEDWRILSQMALAAEAFYGETEYKEILQSLIDETQDEKLKDRYIVILNEEADNAWKIRDYEEVIARLEEAYCLDPSNEQIRNELIKITEEYVEYCRKNQQYDEGLNCIARIRDLLEDNFLFVDQENTLLAVQNSDGMIQEMLNQLNVFFEEDNIEGIQEIMEGEEWKKQTENVSRVFYSENLLARDTVSGKGTGVYKIFGNIYVYYGNFENGIRQGEGLWYYDNGKGTLDKYSLHWVNGLPQGEGTCDRYSILKIYGYGGVELGEEKTHNIESFSVVDGCFDGKFSETISTSYARGSMDIMYVGGIGEIVDTPEEIAYYLSAGDQIIGWGEMSNDSLIWMPYSPYPRKIAGIWKAAQYTVSDIVLE